MGLKTVTLQGRLVRDPESRTAKSGTEICTFTVAVDSNRPPKGDEKQEASFFRVTAFGKRGLTCQKYLNKGDEVSVSGDIELDVFVTQEGKTYANMQVIANEIHFGRKSQAGNNAAPQQQQQQRQTQEEYDNVY